MDELKFSLDKQISINHGRVHETEDILRETPERCELGTLFQVGRAVEAAQVLMASPPNPMNTFPSF